MEWASALSVKERWADALEQVTTSLRDQLSAPPHLIFCFVSPVHAVRAPDLGARLRAAFPGARVVACTASGTIGAHREIEQKASISCVAAALPGVDIELRALTGAQAMRGELWPEWHAADAQAIIMLSDPATCAEQEVLRALELRYPGATIVGGGASAGNFRGANTFWLDSDARREGALIAILRGNIILDAIVSPGCSPIGRPMIVMDTRDGWITSLDQGRPADLSRELFATLEPNLQDAMRKNLFLGIALIDSPTGEYHPWDFLVRKVRNVDPETGAICTRARPRRFEVVQFHVLEGGAARLELHTMCARWRTTHPSTPVRGAMLFSCISRGQALYGQPDHDTQVVREYFGQVPLGGLFCHGEFGPVAGRVFTHTYTSTLALFRERDS